MPRDLVSYPGGVARAAPDAGALERRMMRWLFVATSCVLLLVHNGGVSGLDGETMFQAARMAIDHQRVDVGPGFNSLTGVNGQEYSRANVGLPLLAALVYLLMAPVTWFVPGHSDLVRTAAVGAIMPLICAGNVVAVYQLARTLGARVPAALIVGIGTVGGTYLLPYSKEFFAEPLAALGIVIAVERALSSRPLAAGCGLAIAVLARAQSLLLVPIVTSVVVYRRGARGGIRALGPLGVALALTAAYNIARFGNPLSFGYQDLGFSMPYLSGVQILLFSPKSLFLFAPVTVLFPWIFIRLWQRNKPAVVVIGSTLAITLSANAMWQDPSGGWCWGPRLLIPSIPPAIAAVGPWLDRRFNWAMAVALLVFGFAVSAPAVLLSTQIQQLHVPPPAGNVWPGDNPLPTADRQVRLVPATVAYTRAHLYERQLDGRNNLRFLNFWQLGLARIFGPRGLLMAVAASLVMLLTACYAAKWCRAAYRQLPPDENPVRA
jgi:hypothetical protein